jgi:predicted PurR-regulated permease PerM
MSNSDEALTEETLRHLLTDTLIRIGILAFLVYLCVQVFAPFSGLMMWALILAIALYPLNLMLAKKLGGKSGLAATIIVLAGLLVIGGPTVMIGESFASHLHSGYNKFESGQLAIPTPSEKVAEWPLVGEKVYSAWSNAADNLPAFLEDSRPQLVEFCALGCNRCRRRCLYPGIAARPWLYFCGCARRRYISNCCAGARYRATAAYPGRRGGDASTASNIFFTIYLMLAGMSDNILKPMLLGRGVDVPMPIVLFGALGGMVSAGIIGLFIGAILLSVGYQLFIEWVAEASQNGEEDSVVTGTE